MFSNNAFRTILVLLTAVSAAMGSVLGCTTDTVGATVCTASWLSPQMSGYAIIAFSALAVVLKAARPGGWLAGLFGATAVVSPSGNVGTVTAKQVANKSPSQ